MAEMRNPDPVKLLLRDVLEGDLPVFFEQQLDPGANFMAAFTRENSADREAFMAHWGKILSDEKIGIKTIVFGGQVAGYVLHHSWFGEPEVGYWIGTEFWGRGIASGALAEFLRLERTRPLHAHVAIDNLASRRVLEKNGFVLSGQGRGYSHARGGEVEELILTLG
jgi:RimJ/RimL family protein N-acetyltransferase